MEPTLERATRRPPVVLVADDEASILDLVSSLMKREGYQVLPASDGCDALELSRSYPGKIDLAITDMDMPRLSGSDLCFRLLEERPGINPFDVGDSTKLASWSPARRYGLRRQESTGATPKSVNLSTKGLCYVQPRVRRNAAYGG